LGADPQLGNRVAELQSIKIRIESAMQSLDVSPNLKMGLAALRWSTGTVLMDGNDRRLPLAAG